MRALAVVGVAGALGLGTVTSAAAALPPIGQHAGQLVAAAAQVNASAAELRTLAGQPSRTPAQVRAAAQRLVTAATSARDVLARYRDSKVRDGSLTEADQLRTMQNELLEALGRLQKLAGAAPPRPSKSQRRAAQRATDDADGVVKHLVKETLRANGLEDIVKGPVLRNIGRRVERNAKSFAHGEANRALKRFTGVGIVVGVPLKQQVAGAAQAAVARSFSKFLVSAGPGGIAIQLLLGSKVERVINLVGKALTNALRFKGRLKQRTARSIRTLNALAQAWRELQAKGNPGLDELRKLARRMAEAVNGTKFLQGDLRAKNPELAAQLQTALGEVTSLLGGYTHVLESEPFRVSLSQTAANAARARAAAAKVLAKLPAATPEPLTIPTGAVCQPSTITLEQFVNDSPTGTKRNATFKGPIRDQPGSSYQKNCLWFWDDGSGEAFIVTVGYAPPTAQGTIPGGDCDHNSNNPRQSDKRYLTAGGGNRSIGWHAVGGDDSVLLTTLAAAEGAGVGQAC